MRTAKGRKMKKDKAVDLVAWLNSEAGERAVEQSMKDANDRTDEICNKMVVQIESLLKPVTL